MVGEKAMLESVSPDKLAIAKGCWLASAIIDGEWGLGCIACCANNGTGPFAAFHWRGNGKKNTLKQKAIIKHRESMEHKRAVAAYFGQEGPSLPSPSEEEFVKILDTLLLGRAQGDTNTKSRAMIWCLHEALLDIDRKFLESAKTMVLCRDDRNLRLLMRFVASNADLEVRSGVLGVGVAHRARPDADGIVSATKEVLDKFCTPRRNAPVHGRGPKEIDDPTKKDLTSQRAQKLLVHLQTIIEVIAVDEEAAELKAADIGRGRRASATELAPITPNLKFVTRDKAHGFRRIT